MIAKQPQLEWPGGWVKTPAAKRRVSSKTHTTATAREAMQKLAQAVRAIGGEQARITTHLPLLAGEPAAASTQAGESPGASVFFTAHRVRVAIACDHHTQVAENLAALARLVENLHGASNQSGEAAKRVLEAFAWDGTSTFELKAAPNVPHWSEREAPSLEAST